MELLRAAELVEPVEEREDLRALARVALDHGHGFPPSGSRGGLGHGGDDPAARKILGERPAGTRVGGVRGHGSGPRAVSTRARTGSGRPDAAPEGTTTWRRRA
ncbi:hypothetical protein CCE01nite_26730 [Cellulomonas cellasea]|uniref:Uncharacterized protein n=1 Tax=Cellulomonas cellasea TaxID=43670 RepID=A0A4Y3KZ59_9CELL|nr:hypothetical protein CCE01nite_26730 [Cellulomonas cellasea]